MRTSSSAGTLTAVAKRKSNTRPTPNAKKTRPSTPEQTDVYQDGIKMVVI
jgi:hypothetical protein